MMNNSSLFTMLMVILVSSLSLMVVFINQQPTGAASLNQRSANGINFLTYENFTLGIKIEYPSDWIKVEDYSGSWFRNNNQTVNVRVESIPYLNESLDNLTTQQINLTAQQFPGRQLIDTNGTIIGDNYTAHKIVFTFPEEPADLNGLWYKEIQVWTINAGRAYIISYYTPVYDYDNYLPFAQKMVDSFRILKAIK